MGIVDEGPDNEEVWLQNGRQRDVRHYAPRNSVNVGGVVSPGAHQVTPKRGCWSVIVEAFGQDGTRDRERERSVFFMAKEKAEATVCFDANVQYAKRMHKQGGGRFTVSLYNPDVVRKKRKEI